MLDIYNCDCVSGAKKYLADGSVDLLICDPPFGINETQFHRHYNRDESLVLDGYVEAPADYRAFTEGWLAEARRVLAPAGSLYLVSGWTRLPEVLAACQNAGFRTVNHLVWKYGFGVNTSKKFVTSHYHILYLAPTAARPKFNTRCRFGSQERDAAGRSLLYQDLEDVWAIPKDYLPGEVKNKNKLPDALVRKMVQYSSDPGDRVGDFFLGNFTTARVARRLGRRVCGFEMNPAGFNQFLAQVAGVEPGCDLAALPPVPDDRPPNQGKPFAPGETDDIRAAVAARTEAGATLSAAVATTAAEFGRGKWSVLRVLKGLDAGKNPDPDHALAP